MTPPPVVNTTFLLVLSALMFHSPYLLARDAKLAGMGVRKCAEWMQWKEARNGEARANALEWAQGFIAGHNVYARSTSSVVADVKVLVPLLDAYCQKNPEDRLFLGVIEINQSLGGARVKLTPNKPAAPGNQMPQAPRSGKPGEIES